MDLRDQLQTTLGASYTIDRELAGGGMSRVFLATEVALGRQVVVKVLSPELAAEMTAERFAREIQVVARLQQANIVPLLTAGHTGDVPFYTMPFVEGLSLRQRLAERGTLAIGDAIGILRDVARALAYAHDAGVVHRDIKPENVLISGGAAVVTDFGIAKAISVARTQPGLSPTLTQAGSGIGTPAYMAPEQAAGDPSTDHRADVYSFGCLAYELLTGKPPFRSHSVHELITAHMTQAAAPVRSVRPDIPAGLAALVDRCLEKRPDRRPQSARELLDTLDAVATPGSHTTGNQMGSRRGVAIGIAVAVLAAAGWFIAKGRGAGAAAASDPSIAVIPFVNVGGDSAQDYLADGMGDELATAIGKLPGVHLAARSSAYRFRGRRDLDVREIGKTLQVNLVVQGAVRRLGDQLRISAQLSDASNGRELWAESFDRTTKDVFRTQDDITAAITKALASRLSAAPARRASAVAQGTTNADAYDLYLRGEFFLRRREMQPATEMFERAIALDSGFARAYAGLSNTLALLPYYSSTSATAVFDRVAAASRHALARDSTLAEAHMSLGVAYMHAWRWDEAKAAFDRAIAADPADLQSRFQFGRYYYYRGDDARALAEWNRGLEIDPFSALTYAWIGQLQALTGKLAPGLAATQRAIEYDSSAAATKQCAVRVYLQAHDTVRARALADRLPNMAPWTGVTAYVHALTGDREGALATVRKLEADRPAHWFTNTGIAFASLGLGDTAKALAALERATDAREIWPTYHRVGDPMFDSIRGSARWAALMRRVGLDGVPGAVRVPAVRE